MGYYDSVKDSVRDNDESEGDNMNSNNGNGNFDTLKQNAEETADDEDEGDDTPIEVLEEDGLKREPPSETGSKQEGTSQGNPLTSETSESTDSNASTDMEGVEERLDKIIEQNKKMIEILESFGQ